MNWNETVEELREIYAHEYGDPVTGYPNQELSQKLTQLWLKAGNPSTQMWNGMIAEALGLNMVFE